MTVLGPPPAADNPLAERGQALLFLWYRRRSIARSALLVRLAVAGFGVLAILSPLHPKPVPVLLTAVGLLIAVARPARVGALLAVLAAIWGWLASYGLHGSPPLWRVACFAVALYLLHSGTALAAAVPLSCRLQPSVALRWLRRCLVNLAISAVLVAVLEVFTRRPGSDYSYLMEVGGLLGIVAILSVIVVLFSRTPR